MGTSYARHRHAPGRGGISITPLDFIVNLLAMNWNIWRGFDTQLHILSIQTHNLYDNASIDDDVLIHFSR